MNEWISVKERLPSVKKDVLMYYASSDNMAVGFLFETDEDMTFWRAYTDAGWTTDCDESPSHWMPLPEPPEEDTK